jgi:bla regulator protein BlaR1
MRDHLQRRRYLIIATAGFVVVFVAGALTAPRLRAQAPAGQSPAPQSPAVPQWQIDAGGKMAFDVASVKPNKSVPARPTSNIPLDSDDDFTPTGGLFSATDFPLLEYTRFAYKLTPEQSQDLQSQLPKLANTFRYDIQAHASGIPTKDQFRLMMQALLADRFKMVVHFETEQRPVFALVLDKPGKLGPHLQPHSDAPPCAAPAVLQAPVRGPVGTVTGGFPELCGALLPLQPDAPGHAGARNVTMEAIANTFSSRFFGVDRPILDKTGLTGKYDLVIDFVPQVNGPQPLGGDSQPDASGPTFLEALKEQLGLRLEPQTGPVAVLVVDHAEEPSPN